MMCIFTPRDCITQLDRISPPSPPTNRPARNQHHDAQSEHCFQFHIHYQIQKKCFAPRSIVSASATLFLNIVHTTLVHPVHFFVRTNIIIITTSLRLRPRPRKFISLSACCRRAGVTLRAFAFAPSPPNRNVPSVWPLPPFNHDTIRIAMRIQRICARSPPFHRHTRRRCGECEIAKDTTHNILCIKLCTADGAEHFCGGNR